MAAIRKGQRGAGAEVLHRLGSARDTDSIHRHRAKGTLHTIDVGCDLKKPEEQIAIENKGHQENI